MLPPEDEIRVWLETWIPKGTGRALEIGCFPGRFVSVFGGLGYEVHGIDLIPEVVSHTPKWLGDVGFRVGDFICGDFFEFDPNHRFDVVSSFGFIEHFDPWEPALERHVDLVAEGGYIVVTVPNFQAPPCTTSCKPVSTPNGLPATISTQ